MWSNWDSRHKLFLLFAELIFELFVQLLEIWHLLYSLFLHLFLLSLNAGVSGSVRLVLQGVIVR